MTVTNKQADLPADIQALLSAWVAGSDKKQEPPHAATQSSRFIQVFSQKVAVREAIVPSLTSDLIAPL